MRRSSLVILSCLAQALALVPAEAASEVTAMRILNKSFDSQSQQLGYELFNDSGKTITAWRLSLARGDSHGHGQRSTLDQDFSDRQSDQGLRSRGGPIHPGSRIPASWQLDVDSEDEGHIALSLKVAAVVFEDLTWEGEPEAASAILEARLARVEEVGKVLADLENQALQRRSRQALSAVLKEKSKSLKREGDGSDSSAGAPREVAAVVSATRLELAQWLEDAGREVLLSPDPAEALGALTSSLRDRYTRGLQSTLRDGQAAVSAPADKGGDR